MIMPSKVAFSGGACQEMEKAKRMVSKKIKALKITYREISMLRSSRPPF